MRGRPTKYRPIFVKKVDKYYKKCLKDNVMPFIEDVAMLLEVDPDTITNWTKANKHFFGAIDRIKLLQRMLLKKIVARTPQGAIFLLKANHGLIEAEKVLHGGTPEEEPIRFTVGPIQMPIKKSVDNVI